MVQTEQTVICVMKISLSPGNDNHVLCHSMRCRFNCYLYPTRHGKPFKLLTENPNSIPLPTCRVRLFSTRWYITPKERLCHLSWHRGNCAKWSDSKIVNVKGPFMKYILVHPRKKKIWWFDMALFSWSMTLNPALWTALKDIQENQWA